MGAGLVGEVTLWCMFCIVQINFLQVILPPAAALGGTVGRRWAALCGWCEREPGHLTAFCAVCEMRKELFVGIL